MIKQKTLNNYFLLKDLTRFFHKFRNKYTLSFDILQNSSSTSHLLNFLYSFISFIGKTFFCFSYLKKTIMYRLFLTLKVVFDLCRREQTSNSFFTLFRRLQVIL